MRYTLLDTSAKEVLDLNVLVHQEPGGIAVEVPGIQNGDGRPVFIEYRQGMLRVCVWTDPSDESPTHQIEVSL